MRLHCTYKILKVQVPLIVSEYLETYFNKNVLLWLQGNIVSSMLFFVLS
jgi:hypothetical protein